MTTMKTTKKKQRFSIDEKIENSKFSYTKNLKYFIIAPLLIIVAGIVLLCTLGFNLGFDFTGGTSMTVFTNFNNANDSVVLDELEQSYNLENGDEYQAACEKIEKVLNSFGLSASSYQAATMTITSDEGYSYTFENCDAILFKIQNADAADVESQNEEIKLALLKEFGYVSDDITAADLENVEFSALVSNGGVIEPSTNFELTMRIMLAFVIAIVLVFLYVGFRFDFTTAFAVALALFHDVLITAAMMLICRIQISIAFFAALFMILCYSVYNTIIIFDRIKENLKLSKNLGKVDNHAVANKAVANTMMRTLITTIIALVLILFVIIIGVNGVREFAFPMLVGILASFYSSVFLAPGLWAMVYRPSKRKIARMAEKERLAKEKSKEQYEV